MFIFFKTGTFIQTSLMISFLNMKNIKFLCMASVFTALICVITLFLQIPIPLGYFNIGNCIILMACLFLPASYGFTAACIGSALADLLSYPVWTIPTIIIKGLMVIVFYLLMRIPIKKLYVSRIIAAAICLLIPFAGYTFSGIIIYGNFITGLAQAPGLLAEYIVNLILFVVFSAAAYRIIPKRSNHESK